jgi:hypothetical protein
MKKIQDLVLRAACVVEGLDADCGAYSIGGANRLILLNKSQIASYTLETTPGPAFGSLKTLVMDSTFQGYEIAVTTKSLGFTTAANGFDDPASSKNFQHTGTFTLGGTSQAVDNFIHDLGLANVVAVVVSNEQNNAGTENRILVYGLGSGLNLTAVDGGTGTATTDLSGFVLTLSGADIYPAKEVITGANTAWLAALLTPAP